ISASLFFTCYPPPLVLPSFPTRRSSDLVHEVWPVGERIIVCVGTGPLSPRLVRATKRMSTRLHAEWVAVSVETPRYERLPQKDRSEEHTSELQLLTNLVCRLLLEKKK